MRLISKLPRSGTWYTKYLLTFIHRLSADMSIDIRDVFADVVEPAHATVRDDREPHLRHASQRSGLPLVQVSHYICPGFLTLEDNISYAAKSVLDRIGALNYHLEAENSMHDYAPKRGGRVCFIYRNPFSVFLSYARRFNDRAQVTKKKEILFNPHWPIAVDFQNQLCDDPLSHYISNFRRSNFMEAFMIMAVSYLHMQRLFPNNVRIMRYEDIRQNEYERMKQILGFLDFPVDEDTFNSNFKESLRLVSKENMTKYETILGHSLSGSTNYYGEEKKNHITRTPETDWKNTLPSDDVVWAKNLVQAFHPGLEHMLE